MGNHTLLGWYTYYIIRTYVHAYTAYTPHIYVSNAEGRLNEGIIVAILIFVKFATIIPSLR